MKCFKRLSVILPKFFAYLILGLSIIFVKTSGINAELLIMNTTNPPEIIEHLRIKVPEKYRDAWLIAEKHSWEKWLSQKQGFLGRKLFWDPQSEEATLLISWASRSEWKSISQDEIASVQESFEAIARNAIDQASGNPFPLVFEGELLPQ